MISSTSEYALRIVAFLASREAHSASRDELVEGTKTPRGYLVKVMKQLDEAGLIASQRGRGGGYRLLKTPDTISVYDVIAAIAELPRIERCPLGRPDHISLCPLHQRLDDAAAAAELAFRETRISELVEQGRTKAQCPYPQEKLAPKRARNKR